MGSPSLLDFSALLQPIPGDDPAGGALPFSLRDKLDESRKEVDPADFAPDDPTRPAEPIKPDWAGIVRLTQDGLTNTCKSLALAARLTEALTKLHGFTGVRDGLHLLRLLVEQCWERLSPPLADDDALEVRAGPLNWLGDADRGARFPAALRLLPLVSSDKGEFSWTSWRQSGDGRDPAAWEAFESAVQIAPPEQCQTLAEDVEQSAEELEQLERGLADKMADSAPALSELRRALEDCRLLTRQILQRKGPLSEEKPSPPSSDGAAPPTSAAPPTAATSRAEVYRQLREAANRLQQLEPHSPIPYLIHRAVALGALPFPRLIKELIRDDNILQELNREFGIQESAGGTEDEPK